MGWGMLAGIGEGLSNYSSILGQQRERKFELKKDEIAFERQKSLEELRVQNQNTRDQKQRDWALDDRKYSEGREDKLYERNKKDSMEAYEAKKELDYQYAVKLAGDEFSIKQGLGKQARENKAKEVESVFMEDGELSPWEQVKLASIRVGVDYKDLIAPQGKPMSADMVEQLTLMLSTNEKFLKADPKEQVNILKKTHDYLQNNPVGNKTDKSGETEEDIAALSSALNSDNASTRQKAVEYYKQLDPETKGKVMNRSKSLYTGAQDRKRQEARGAYDGYASAKYSPMRTRVQAKRYLSE